MLKTKFFMIAAWAIGLSVRAQELRLLSLEDCIEIAIENNLAVRRSELALEGSKVNLTQSRANQLPNLNFNSNLGWNWGRSINPTTNQFITQQFTFNSVGGSSNVVLFNGMALANTVKQNRVNVESAEFDLEETKNLVSINITTFYLNVIFNRELLENARFQLESSREQYIRIKKLVELGSLARLNELDLAAQVASNEVGLINAQNNLDLALLSLKQAMLIPANSQIDIIIPEIDIENIASVTFTANEVYQTAVNNQPQIKSADLGVESAKIGLRVSSGAALPTLAAGANFNTNYSNAFKEFVSDGGTAVVPIGAFTQSGEPIFTNRETGDIRVIPYDNQMRQNLSRGVGFSLSVPVFNGMRNYSNIQRSKIQLQQAELAAIERRNQLRQVIESAYTDAVAASKTYNASKKQVEALEESYRAIQSQYTFGAANFTDFQVSNNNLFRAKSDFVRAKYDYLFKMKILDFYQGNPLTIN